MLSEHIQISNHIKNIIADLVDRFWRYGMVVFIQTDARAYHFRYQPPNHILQLFLIRCGDVEPYISSSRQNFGVVGHILIQGSHDNRAFLLSQLLQQISCSLLLVRIHTKLQGESELTVLDH